MFNRTLFKKRILFVGIPDMAYIGLDGLLMSGVNIVGVLGPKKDHNMYYDFKTFVQSRRLNYIDYDNLMNPSLLKLYALLMLTQQSCVLLITKYRAFFWNQQKMDLLTYTRPCCQNTEAETRIQEY